ncbi:hypothetical protein HPB47_014308, partial [Ixodes persulcatus]
PRYDDSFETTLQARSRGVESVRYTPFLVLLVRLVLGSKSRLFDTDSELNDVHHGRGTPSRLDLEVVLETKVDRRGREVLAQSEDDSVLSGWYNFIYWLLDFLLSEQYDAVFARVVAVEVISRRNL